MFGIEPPGKDRLAEGPRRDLVLALHDIYRGAGRPGLRRIANEISRNHDYRDTVSYETAGAILRGEGVPRWSKLECLVRQLVAWHHPHLEADEQVSRFLALWNAASNPAESSQSEPDIARSIADQLQQEVEQLREQLAAARRANEALARARSTDQRTTDGAFRSFPDLIRDHWSAGRHLCIGLDSDASRIPASLRPDADIAVKMLAFNERIVDATFDLVCAYKLNSAYYEALGSVGLEVLSKTVEYINVRVPRTPVIIDAKRADIGDAGRAYARFLFDEVGADAVTVQPYLGREALKPILERSNKQVFVVVRTSNPGAGEFQDLIVDGLKLYLHIATAVANEWNRYGNCGLVVGASYIDELRDVRKLVSSDIPILIPGVGTQGESLEASVHAVASEGSEAFIVNVSRSVIFASTGQDFDEIARSEATRLTSVIESAVARRKFDTND